MSNFSVIHDLGPLSETQRQDYLRQASEYFGLDPSLNALDLIWMNNTDGIRRLIAYARRGTTDILREIHGISVLSVTMQTAPGFVSFTAIGKNAKNRQEIAVGAAGTDGLKGDRLAAAVSTAQTRATRRLTLQFVGGGLLDESEVGDSSTTDINRLNVSLSSIATAPVQPVVDANVEAGKDVTPNGGLSGTIEKLSGSLMGSPTPFSGGSIIPTVLSNPVQPPPEGSGLLEEPKRKRRKKTVEDIVEEAGIETEVQSPIVPLAEAATPVISLEITQAGNEIIQNLKESIQPLRDAASESFNLLEPSIISTYAEFLAQYPTDQQEKEFRQRLGVFTNGILKEGGMTDGIIWRVRKYTLHLCPGALIDGGKMKLTVAEWTKLLFALEGINASDGPKGLVQTINDIAEKA